jgi:hypothetical protein
MAESIRIMKTRSANPLAQTGLSNRQSILVLAVIILLGAWLRLPGNFYPATVHFDEGMLVDNVLCRYPPSGAYYHPFLSRSVLTVAEAVPCIRAWLRGSPHPARETEAAFVSDPVPFLILGRSISLLFGLATVALTYLLASRLGGTGMGLTAALFVAISPTDVIVSNNLGHWCLATLLTVVVFLSIRSISEIGTSQRRLVMLGVFFGLAVAVVYTMGLLALPILVALVARWRSRKQIGAPTRWLPDILAVAAGTIIGHAVGNFTALLQPKLVLHEIFMPEASLFSDESPTNNYFQNVGWYVGSIFGRLGLGWAIAVAGTAGLLLAARRANPMWLAILVFTTAILIIQPAAVVLFANRYTAPVTPLIAMAAAWLLLHIGQRLAGNELLAKFRPAVLLVVLAALPGLWTDIAFRQALALTPTRELARRWIETTIPPGSGIVQSIEYMNPVVLDCDVLRTSSKTDLALRPCYDVSYAPMDPERFESDFLSYIANSKAQYLVYTATTPPGTLKRLGLSLHIGAALRARYPLLARFGYTGLDGFYDDTVTVNPAVEVYRLKN